MPAQTHGFLVSADPGMNYLPASSLTPQANIVGSISQGAGLASQLAQIGEDAKLAPVKLALQQIALQDAQNKVSLFPTEQQLQQVKLQEAAKQAAVPITDLGGVNISGGDQTEYPSAIDENGERTGPSDFETNPLIKTQQLTKYGPGGTATPGEQVTTLKTAEQIDQEREKAAAAVRASDALAQRRATPKAFEYDTVAAKYQEAVQDGDVDAAALYKARLDKLNAGPSVLPTGTNFNRVMEKNAAEAGFTQDQLKRLAQTPDGVDAISKISAQRRNAARGGRPIEELALTPTQAALVQASREPLALGGAGTAAAPGQPMFSIPNVNAPAAAPVVNTQDEYDALDNGAPYIDSETGQQHVKGR